MEIRHTVLLFLLLLTCGLQAQEDPYYYAEQQRTRIECSIYESKMIQADDALDLKAPNSFNAQMSAYMKERFTDEQGTEKRLQLHKYFDDQGEVVKVEARSYYRGIGANKQAMEMRVLSTYYYLAEENNILIHQMTNMNGEEMQDEFDTGWILFDAATGEVKVMVVNEEEQDETAMERPENEKIAQVSYIGALLFKELD